MYSGIHFGLAVLLSTLLLSVTADARHRHHHHHHGSQSIGLAEVPPSDQIGGPEGWTTYLDSRSGMSVDYPANVFSIKAKDQDSDQGTEGVFYTADKRAKMRVYFLPNIEDESPRSYIKHHLNIDRRDLNYNRVTHEFFAISGKHDDSIFYSRCNFAAKDRAMHCVYLEYPQHEKRAWDGIVTRISRSLKARDNTAEGARLSGAASIPTTAYRLVKSTHRVRNSR